MITHLLIALAAAPFQFGLAAINSRKEWFTMGEVRFWGVVIFVAAELIYLGSS